MLIRYISELINSDSTLVCLNFGRRLKLAYAETMHFSDMIYHKITFLFFSLIRPEIFAELISLIITEPPQDVDETDRYKLPHVAAELLCCEVPQFSSAMFQEEGALLDKLYSIMEMEAPLNPLLASFFCKSFAVLLTRKAEQVRLFSRIIHNVEMEKDLDFFM